jgi:hypothetical protein
MAKGRIIDRELPLKENFANMSRDAQLFYYCVYGYLDRDGLITGNPFVLAGRTAPLHNFHERAGGFINEWIAHGLVIRYDSSEGPILFFPQFRKDNQNLKYGREGRSQYPPPPGYKESPNGLVPIDPEIAGRQAGDYDLRSKYHEALTEAAQHTGAGDDAVVDEILTTSGLDPDLIRTTSGRRTTTTEVQQQSEVEVEVEDNNNKAEPETAVVVALQAFGFKEDLAKGFFFLYGAERIEEKIEYLRYLEVHDPQQVKKPRGWLRSAIEKDYGPPDGYGENELDIEAARRKEYSKYNNYREAER